LTLNIRPLFIASLLAATLPAHGQEKALTSTVKALRLDARVDTPEAPGGWTTWSPRAEIRPNFVPSPRGGRDGGPALGISGGDNPAAVGAWRRVIEGVEPGKSYRFEALYRATGVKHPTESVSARLVWQDAKGQPLRAPDFAWEAGKEGDWTRLLHTTVAPENARRVSVELGLIWAPKGSVVFDGVSLFQEDAPRDRSVRVMTVYHRPSNTKSAEASVREFVRVLEANGAKKPDIVCLPEGATVIGTGKSYAEVAEAVPGPTTRTLGETAKRLNSYIVAGLYERVGPVIYNTSVLIGRDGRLVGKYRKTHLPREEVEAGLTPGSDYPVFDTDFGKVGMMICWDVQFPEPARAMAEKGAELILLPIWGGSETLAKARAIENHVFLVSSSFDMKTFIVDPTGAVLAEATASDPAPVATIHLDRPIIQPWLGNMKARTWKERALHAVKPHR
jgi:predicted amidohydrolase